MTEKLTIRPYARLITMLGEQLIKNELIALVELIKNSYDADASWVKISFCGFNEDFSITNGSKIIIEDDGCGMSAEILKKAWLNPATPEKLKKKRAGYKQTPKGRRTQGEKGIGRFAIFKLGRNIKIVSRRQVQNENGYFQNEGEDYENVLTYNFDKYDDDFLTEDKKEKELFLEDLDVELSVRKPEVIVKQNITLGNTQLCRSPYGTKIEISSLKSNNWSQKQIEKIQEEIGKLLPIFTKDSIRKDFNVFVYANDVYKQDGNVYIDKLLSVFDKAVYKVTDGKYLSGENVIEFKLNGEMKKLSLNDSKIKGLSLYKVNFAENAEPVCGSFKFEFYVFDFNADVEASTKYYLDTTEKEIIKNHRIYLYRDGIRVMPYGSPEDDWLGIDISRGTVKASSFLSNDQIVGCVYITQEENPLLIDKTNREGLIDNGRAPSDFVAILKIILQYLRAEPYARYLIDKKKKKITNAIKNGHTQKVIETAKENLADDTKALKYIKLIDSSYNKEISVYKDRIHKTEDLAAVGLSVETASHDLMLVMGKTFNITDNLLKAFNGTSNIDKESVANNLATIRGNLSFIEAQLKNVQRLFPSTKSRTKSIRVIDIAEKVRDLYLCTLSDNNIKTDFKCKGSPIVAKTTDAVLLQVFINLFDNALYWLKTVDRDKEIKVVFDGDAQKVIFSDNGPGIKKDDVGYIFEAFYSGKGQDGRGLGLYIARQLLDRYDYTIELAEYKKDKLLSGANFVIEFVKEGIDE